MNGLEALKMIKKGYKITCKSWNNRDWYLWYSDNSGFVFSVQSQEFPRIPEKNPQTPWSGLHNQEIIEDFLNNIFEHDWEILYDR